MNDIVEVNSKNRMVLEGIRSAIEKHPEDMSAYSDFLAFNKIIANEDFGGNIKPTIEDNLWLRQRLFEIVKTNRNVEQTIEGMELLKKTFLYTAKDDFVDYMTLLEWNRPVKERFWQPRARILGKLAKALQMLADDEIDELFISQPPRTGKTTMVLFFTTWVLGKFPEKSNLYSAFSSIITGAFYDGVLEIINDKDTYLWSEVFENSKVVKTNAQDNTIDIDRRKRYPTLTCRSLYGTLNGACDCMGLLVSDDLIGGIEEALNKDRLISAWSKVDNNLLPRAKEKAKVLWVGTRWSNSDPIGLRMNILQTDSRFRERRFSIINMPALDSAGASNFDYDFGVGFSTKYFQMRKASFEKNNDEASWFAQYMGQPVERSGTLFEVGEMKYFNGELPDESTLIRKFAACDPAFGGGDYCSMPICYQYESGTYVVDVVFSNATKNFTQPTITNRIINWEVGAVQFECNASTASFKEKVEELLKEKGYRCNITYRAAPPNASKEARIYEKSPEIREFYFLEGAKRSPEYEQFMNNLFSFQINGRNKHDDAPDSLAMCVEMMTYTGFTMKVRKRFF